MRRARETFDGFPWGTIALVEKVITPLGQDLLVYIKGAREIWND